MIAVSKSCPIAETVPDCVRIQRGQARHHAHVVRRRRQNYNRRNFSQVIMSKKLISRLLCYCFHQYFELINRHFCLICRNFNQLYETNCPTAILLANKKIRRQVKVMKIWQTYSYQKEKFFAKITKRKVFLTLSEWQTSS